MIGPLLFDLRYALRGLRKSPGFALVVVMMLALGIGANTAMFTVIRAVLLKPLSYQDPDTLVEFVGGASMIRFEETRAAQKSYSGVGAYLLALEDVALSGTAEPEVLKQARVSANFMDILGIQPALGRGFREEEDAEGAPPVAIISTGLWQRRFAGDPSIVGRAATLGGIAHHIVGVMPPDFRFPLGGGDVWVPRPSNVQTVQVQSRRISPVLTMFARLKPGVSLGQANAEFQVLRRQFVAAHPEMLDARPDPNAHVASMRDQLVSSVRSMLWMLFAAVGSVLLIACANVASLLMARANARSREFAVRAAIGAGRGRLIAQLVAESLPLALIGGVLGVALAETSLVAISRMTALAIPRFQEIRLDPTVLLFALAVSIATGVLFGLAPAFGASKPNLADSLRAAGVAGQSTGIRWAGWLNLRSALVVGQVALSIVLLIGAGLLTASLGKVYRVDLGFQTNKWDPLESTCRHASLSIL